MENLRTVFVGLFLWLTIFFWGLALIACFRHLDVAILYFAHVLSLRWYEKYDERKFRKWLDSKKKNDPGP